MNMPFNFALVVSTLMFVVAFAVGPVSAAVIPEPPDINARSHLLIDLGSGQVLSEYQADESLPPASLTKLMTSYVLSYELNQGSVSGDDLVDVSENAWAKKFPGSSLMWIEVGTKVSVENLHRGIIISSGNDASVAIAEHLAGSQDAFAEVMNKHAEELGMHGSHFVNAHGLPDSNHYMTARDLATLAGAMISRFPKEYEIYSEKEFTFNNITQQNRNKLLWRDSTVDGLKTGHTSEAGYCLVASGKRGDMRLVSVVLGTKTLEARNREAQKLLAYGFRYFDTHKVYAANDVVAGTKVWEGLVDQLNLGVDEDIHLTIPKGKHAELEMIQNIDPDLVAPIEQGDRYGELIVKLDGEVLATAPLVALQSIEQAGFFARMTDTIKRRVQGVIGGAGD
ncbi:MAG: D-alanyl-D-alanine carboxypeptidase family protein [Pseudomonadales bacterium]